jgi:hypothetical protein
MTMIFEYETKKNNELGLYEATLTVELPKVTVTRYKADRNDFKYEMRRAVSEIVEEIIEKAIDE